MKDKIICWWSGGVTSAVACLLAIRYYGKENCRVIFIDTCNEHFDTYRFFLDCEEMYGIEIEIITGIKDYKPRLKNYKDIFLKRAKYYQPNKNTHYYSIADVWDWYVSLNVSYGAVCSTDLKRGVREKWQLENEYMHQVFGFEFDKKEFNRAMSLHLNHPKAKAIFPLLMRAFNKQKCIEVLTVLGIEIPLAYKESFGNNNCLGEEFGCVQGGIGYWQMIYRTNKPYYMKRALKEHELTDKAGFQVTMCKEQSNEAKDLENKKDALLFLLPHPDYPQNRTVLDVKAREPKPMVDCSGFCGTFDLSKRSETEKEINFENKQIDMFEKISV
jgi:hypothetical protein